MRTRARTWAAVLATAVVVAGCTSGDDADRVDGDGTAVPDGWTTYEGAGVSLAHPADWEVRDETDSRVDLVGPEGGDLAPIVAVRWEEWTGLSAADSLQAATANVVTTMPDVEPGDAEPLEVVGGVDGAQRRLEYTQPLTEGEIAVVEHQAVVVGDTIEVLVRAVHRADEFDEVAATFEDIIASLDVEGSAPAPAAAVADQDTTSAAMATSGAIPTRTWSPGHAITAACGSPSKVVAPSAC